MNNGTILLAMRLCVLLLAAGFSSPLAAEPPKNRKFNFEYGARIRAMSADVVRVWLPVPQTNAQQDVEIVKLDLPGKHRISYDPKYGNKILYFEWLPEGQESLEFGVTYRVTRREFWALQSKKQAVLADAERQKFLASNKMVPLGPLDIPVLPMPNKTATRLGLARAIYDHVDSLVKYDKSSLDTDVVTSIGSVTAEQAIALTFTVFSSPWLGLPKSQRGSKLDFHCQSNAGRAKLVDITVGRHFLPSNMAGCRWISPRPINIRS